MKKDKQKVAYHKESKRNVMNDVLTEAGRRAKNRAAEKEAECRLRAALENPTDTNGKPIAGHLLKRIAAERLVTSIGPCSAGTFDYAARIFLAELKYLWGCYTPVSRFVARTGQFILSRIDARNGAIGIVPPELDGAVVTNDFPLFAPNAGRISIAFLTWLSRTLGFVDLCVRASEGTTNRVRLQEDRFLALEIPLPPLAEQRRVVARIEELAAQIHEARTLRHQAAEEAEAILQNAIAPTIGDDWSIVPLEQAVDPERPVTYGIVQAGDHIPDGVPYIRVSDMAKPQLTTVGMLRTAPEIASRYRRSAVREGDIVFAIRATIGKMRFVPRGLDGANLTQGTARIAPSKKSTAPYLYWALQRRDVADSIQAASKGSTFKEITLGRLRGVPVPLPPLAEQRRIVAELDALQAEVGALKRLQAETAAELDALLPAILDRAFRGEL